MSDIVSITSIRVSKKLRDELSELGSKKDSYEDIIWRLIKKSKLKN